MRLIDADELKKELLWGNVYLSDNEINALVDLIDNQPIIDLKSLRPISRLMHDRYGGIKCENCGCCVSIGGKNAYHNAKKAYRF